MTAGYGPSAALGTLDVPVHLNADFDWDDFDPRCYFTHNYAEMRPDDARMLTLVRDWFAEALPVGGPPLEGLDAGSGANLYPALAQLPHCDSITLLEFSRENAEWLESAVRELPEGWRQYWRHMTAAAPGAASADPGAASAEAGTEPETEDARFAEVRAKLRKVCAVVRGSIFDLEPRRWDLGTMFFVAESLTEDPAQFEHALRCFLGALRPGAPFAAAFMEGSQGYEVGDVHFPAVSIDENRLRAAFHSLGLVRGGFKVRRVGIDPEPLRPGYTGYLVAIGHVQD